jgi:hypothetical protein
MSEQLQELMDIPRDFFKDGTQFLNRCTKRTKPSIQIQSRPQAVTIRLETKYPGDEIPLNGSAYTDSFSSGRQGVYKNLASSWCWIPGYGRSRLCCEIKQVVPDLSVALGSL